MAPKPPGKTAEVRGGPLLIQGGVLTPEELAEAYAQDDAALSGDLCAAEAEALRAWRLLWSGTLNLLKKQDRKAYHRLLNKLQKHGLVTPRVEFALRHGRPMVSWDWEVIGSGRAPTAALIRRLRQFAEDETAVPAYRRKPSPEYAMLLAYQAALAYIQKKAREHRPHLRGGGTSSDQATQWVADLFGYTRESAAVKIKAGARWLLRSPRGAVMKSEDRGLWAFFERAKVERKR